MNYFHIVESKNKRNMIIILIFSIAAMAAVGSQAVEVRGALDELPVELRNEAEELRPVFAEISEQLELSNLSDNGALMDLVKMLSQKKVKMFDRFSSEPKKNKLRRRAYKLFLSLAKIGTQCDYESFKILAMNHVALNADSPADNQAKAVKMFRFYAKQHAMYCRPTYRAKFQKLRDYESEFEERETFEWIEEFFSDFEPGEHILDPTGRSEKLSADFLAKLTDRVLQTMSHPELGFKLDTILENNLVGPCANYYDYFRGVFAPAIYDSQLEDKHQAKLLSSSQGDFGVGLQHFRACSWIVRNRHELLERMSKEIESRPAGAGVYMKMQ